MAFTIDQILSAPSAADYRSKMVTALVTMGVPADRWRAGGVASTMLTVASMSLAAMAALLTTALSSFFLPLATGPGLKALALYVYGVTAPSATYASGNVTLTNSGGGVYNKAIGEYTALNPVTRQTYTNTAAFTLGALGTITVPMAAVNIGAIGNAAPGAVDTSVTTLLGVSVSNAASFVAVDELADAELRQLCLNALGARSVRGVRSAYAYATQVAINPVTLGPVNINRWSITESSHTGTVTVYLASPSGAPDTNDVTGVATSVEAIARPSAVTAIVSGATAVPYAPTVTVWCSLPTGTTSAQALTAVNAVILAYFAAYPVGGVTANDDANPTTPFTGLFAAGLYGAIAEGVASVGGVFLSAQGASDLALTAGQVATNSVAVTIRVVAPVGGTVVV